MKTKNINDIVPYIILSVVGVIITGMIVYYIVNSVDSTNELANKVIMQTEEITSDISDYNIKMYDGEEIRGSEVVNFIKKHLGDYDSTETGPIFVEVVTKYTGITYANVYTNNTYVKEIKNFSEFTYYIKPTAIFVGEVINTTNKVIEGIKFSQN